MRTVAEREEPTMHEMTAPAVTVTEVVLPGKVEPAGLRLVQRALPPPSAGQALVRVESTAMSFAETAMRRGRYYGQPPFPFVPGYDLVGVVEAVGAGVDRALVGRRVAALTKTGGWATAALLTAADLVEVPDGVSADEAAGTGEAAAAVSRPWSRESGSRPAGSPTPQAAPASGWRSTRRLAPARCRRPGRRGRR
jgi:NADPH:quinone reductase-like Zn-dependent oxidoreductase